MLGNLLRIAFGVFTASYCSSLVADKYSEKLKPVFKQHCFQCHSGEKVKGEVDLGSIGDLKSLISKPKLHGRTIIQVVIQYILQRVEHVLIFLMKVINMRTLFPIEVFM